MNVDGRLLIWTDEDAYGFCRNHLFVDALEWIRTGPDSAAAPPPSSVNADAGATPASPPATASGDVRLALLTVLAASALGLTLTAAMRRRRRA
jgi:hypothetical protein